MYVDFKYKMGGENLHAYFATWRDDGWMMLELCRFLCYKEDTNFEVLLESFSRCYSGSRTFYVELEGIEFQAIDNASLIKPFGSHCRFFCLYNYNRRVIIDKVEKVEESLGNSMQVMKYEDMESIEEVQFIDNNASFKSEPCGNRVKESPTILDIKFKQGIRCINCPLTMKKSFKEYQPILKSMLSEMNRKKQDMVIEVKDHIIRKSDRRRRRSFCNVLHGSFNEELNLTPSAQSRFETGIVNTNEHHMLSAKEFLYNTSIVKLLRLKPSVQSRKVLWVALSSDSTGSTPLENKEYR
ncbi:hypothetical protein Tco_1241787 [Tanacetum coccineum]